MSDLTHTEAIQRLERHHEQLINELNELNERLEQALDSFIKPSNEAQGNIAPLQPTNTDVTAGGLGAQTC